MNRTAFITALAAVALAAAGGTSIHGAGTALAPEPATLTTDLNLTGAYSDATPSAWALHTSTNVETTAYAMSNTWKYWPGGPPGGTPCASRQRLESAGGTLYAGTLLFDIVEAHGNYRRCVSV